MSLTSYQAAPPRSPFSNIYVKDIRQNAKRNLLSIGARFDGMEQTPKPRRVEIFVVLNRRADTYFYGFEQGELIPFFILTLPQSLQFVETRAPGPVIEAAFWAPQWRRRKTSFDKWSAFRTGFKRRLILLLQLLESSSTKRTTLFVVSADILANRHRGAFQQGQSLDLSPLLW
jgi:hypothetical protein